MAILRARPRLFVNGEPRTFLPTDAAPSACGSDSENLALTDRALYMRQRREATKLGKKYSRREQTKAAVNKIRRDLVQATRGDRMTLAWDILIDAARGATVATMVLRDDNLKRLVVQAVCPAAVE